MAQKQKKTPSEYPLFAFRLNSDQKSALNAMLTEVRSALNKRLNPNDKLWMKNDLIVEALKIGLPQLKSRNWKRK